MASWREKVIAAVYARKSTDDSYKDREAQSTTRQIENAGVYAIKKGWIVDEAFAGMSEHPSVRIEGESRR